MSLLSLFTSLEFSAQTLQPIYLVFGLDLAVLFFVIDPCATLYYFIWKNILTMVKTRAKIAGAAQNYPQDQPEDIAKFVQKYQYIQYWLDLLRMGNRLGCKFDIHGYLFLTIDQGMYKSWMYSLLATLPPAILKLAIQKLMSANSIFKL